MFYWLCDRFGKKLCAIAALQQRGRAACSRAHSCKSLYTQAFARIDAQTGGGNAHERVPPPYFIEDWLIPSGESLSDGAIRRSNTLIDTAKAVPYSSPSDQIPNKTAGGTRPVSDMPPRASLPPQSPCFA